MPVGALIRDSKCVTGMVRYWPKPKPLSVEYNTYQRTVHLRWTWKYVRCCIMLPSFRNRSANEHQGSETSPDGRWIFRIQPIVQMKLRIQSEARAMVDLLHLFACPAVVIWSQGIHLIYHSNSVVRHCVILQMFASYLTLYTPTCLHPPSLT